MTDLTPKGPKSFTISSIEKKNFMTLFKIHERYINSIIQNIKITENKIDSQNKKLINLFNEENKIIIILNNLNKDFAKYENLSKIPKCLIKEKIKLNNELKKIQKKILNIEIYISKLIKLRVSQYDTLNTETPVLNFLEDQIYQGGRKKYKK